MSRLQRGTIVKWQGEEWIVWEWANGPGAYWLIRPSRNAVVREDELEEIEEVSS